MKLFNQFQQKGGEGGMYVCFVQNRLHFSSSCSRCLLHTFETNRQCLSLQSQNVFEMQNFPLIFTLLLGDVDRKSSGSFGIQTIIWLEKKITYILIFGQACYTSTILLILQELFEFGMLTGRDQNELVQRCPHKNVMTIFLPQQTLVMFSKVRRLH